jgi:DNA-binding MarR family transcriptional regulator
MNAPDGLVPRALDAESALAHAPPGHKDELRLWLRMLTCTTLVEGEIRARLRRDFDTTLPRFDLMAALDRAHHSPLGGMALGEISKRMMVSNGNVTGLAARLEAEGLVERRARPGDRRAQLLRLTPKGRREFTRQSAAHEAWIAELLDGLQPEERAALFRLLGRAKASVRAALTPEETP